MSSKSDVRKISPARSRLDDGVLSFENSSASPRTSIASKVKAPDASTSRVKATEGAVKLPAGRQSREPLAQTNGVSSVIGKSRADAEAGQQASNAVETSAARILFLTSSAPSAPNGIGESARKRVEYVDEAATGPSRPTVASLPQKSALASCLKKSDPKPATLEAPTPSATSKEPFHTPNNSLNHTGHRMPGRTSAPELNKDAKAHERLQPKSPLDKARHISPPDLPTTTLPKPVKSKSEVDEALNGCLDVFRDQQQYTVKTNLAKARSLRKCLGQSDFLSTQPRRVFDENILERCYVNGMVCVKKSSPFADLKPMHTSADGRPDSTFNCITIETVESGVKKIKGPSYTVGCRPTRWTDKAKTTPAYTHCTAVKKNVAAPNQRILQSYPYFGEDVDQSIFDALDSRYDVDAPQRARKVLQGQQSRLYMPQTLQWLDRIGISEKDVLFYLLNDNVPDDQKAVYADREKSCKHDFDRTSEHWTTVFSNVASAAPSVSKLQLTAWACAVFLTKMGFSIWQVVRKSDLATVGSDSDDVDAPLLDHIQKLACRVCYQHDCPYHIDYKQVDEDEDDDLSLGSIEALDIDHPHRCNFKRRVALAQPLSQQRPDSRDSLHDEIVGCGADTALDPENRHDESRRKDCCANINMQLGVAKRTLLGRSRIHGFGVYAGEKIRRHEFVGEYSGEIVLQYERYRRSEVYDIQKMSYLFILTADQEIDSHHVGNKMRFVNHASTTGRNGACNLRPEIVICNMTPRIGMYATRDIELGEELFFNYGDHYMSLLRNVNANGEAEELEKPSKGKARENKRGKKLGRRKKNTALTSDFAEPEYEDTEVLIAGEGVGSKTVTPRWEGKGKGRATMDWASETETVGRVREMASKSAPGSLKGLSKKEVVSEFEDEAKPAIELDSLGRRKGGKRKRTEEVEESDFELELEEERTPRRGSRYKRARYALDEGDEEDESAVSVGKKYVAPLINGKKKRGRPRKIMDD
ncbi:hypothetical protein CAC42_407 [Sphaceloma murrayae]|uniref:SET domain-containing protein n=1 Tax=Sphaceloma murrayae TaxID=2082308 RepID=A0A2K1R3F8_9PEZI|nr:hypothetical protein CAC42_407 [Sphaceloma murrayae]